MFLVEVEDRKHHQQEEGYRGGAREAQGRGRPVAEFVEHVAHFLPLHVRVALEAHEADGSGCPDGGEEKGNHY